MSILSYQAADAHKSALDEAVDAAEQEILLLRQQLAAEREKVNILEDSVNDFTRSNGALTTEVLAEREKLQTYEGALIKIANDPNCDRCQVAVDALAKVAK